MEQSYIYIFQELILLNTNRQKYSETDVPQLIEQLVTEVFSPKVRAFEGEVIRELGPRSILRFSKLSSAEDYILDTQDILNQFENQERKFYIEKSSFIWSHNSSQLSSQDMNFLKKISHSIKHKSGVYCSQKLVLKSFISDKILHENSEFYIVQLLPQKAESEQIQAPQNGLKILLTLIVFGFSLVTFDFIKPYLAKTSNPSNYKNIKQSLTTRKPLIIHNQLMGLKEVAQNAELEELLFQYIEQEWELFTQFPDNSNNQPIYRRIELLSTRLPWSANLTFFKKLILHKIEISSDKIPSQKLVELYRSASRANPDKIIIFVKFCIRFGLNPYFLITDLMKYEKTELDELKINFFKECLRFAIVGKEPQLLKWIRNIPELNLIEYLQQWIMSSEIILSKNSFMLLIDLKEIDGIMIRRYLEQKLDNGLKPIDEISAIVQIEAQADREILVYYLEELLQKLQRQNIDPELQNITQKTLQKISK